MALRNTRFCSTAVNNNLHLTNWKRKQGCKVTSIYDIHIQRGQKMFQIVMKQFIKFSYKGEGEGSKKF